MRETGQDILNPARQRDRIDARTLYYLLAKENTTASYAKIGKVVGKSHAFGIKTIKRYMINTILLVISLHN